MYHFLYIHRSYTYLANIRHLKPGRHIEQNSLFPKCPGGYSRSEKNGWKVRNNSEGSASRPAAQHGGAVLRSKTKGLQECGDGDRRKNFGAEDFVSGGLMTGLGLLQLNAGPCPLCFQSRWAILFNLPHLFL